MVSAVRLGMDGTDSRIVGFLADASFLAITLSAARVLSLPNGLGEDCGATWLGVGGILVVVSLETAGGDFWAQNSSSSSFSIGILSSSCSSSQS